MTLTPEQKEALRRLIGRRVRYHGDVCTVVELLEGEAALVLEVSGSRSALQEDQYGDPGRRTAEIHLIALFDEENGGKFHPELLQLGLEEFE
jgi:hypothetical protein